MVHAVGKEVPVSAVAVLWSAEGLADDEPHWREAAGVVLVHGRDFAAWLRGLDIQVLEADRIRELWRALDEHARQYERDNPGVTRRPTLDQLLMTWTLQPAIGAISALYALVALQITSDWRVVFAGPWLAGAFGWRATRIATIRPLALGWTAVSFLVAAATVVTLIAWT
jgi:hypothetical protein